MNSKCYSTLRLALGLFIMLGIAEAGNVVIDHYRQTIQTAMARAVVMLQQKPQAMQVAIPCRSIFIGSSKNHLG